MITVFVHMFKLSGKLTLVGDLCNSHSFRGEVFIEVKEIECGRRELMEGRREHLKYGDEITH